MAETIIDVCNRVSQALYELNVWIYDCLIDNLQEAERVKEVLEDCESFVHDWESSIDERIQNFSDFEEED